MTDKNYKETFCWKCSKPYSVDAEKCPNCGAANGNVTLERAQAEQLDDFARKMRKAPDPLRKCKHGKVYDGTSCPKCREERNYCDACGYVESHDPNCSAPKKDDLAAHIRSFRDADGQWVPVEIARQLLTENANLARALAKEVNGPTFMGEPVIAAPRGKPIAWVVAVEEQGRMKVYGPQYNWLGHAEQDVELPRKRGQKAEVWACYPTTTK